MSHIQGIRNLKELYNYKYGEKPNEVTSSNSSATDRPSALSSRVKLPSFNSTRSKFNLLNTVLPKNPASFRMPDGGQDKPKILQLHLGHNSSH